MRGHPYQSVVNWLSGIVSKTEYGGQLSCTRRPIAARVSVDCFRLEWNWITKVGSDVANLLSNTAVQTWFWYFVPELGNVNLYEPTLTLFSQKSEDMEMLISSMFKFALILNPSTDIRPSYYPFLYETSFENWEHALSSSTASLVFRRVVAPVSKLTTT